MRNSAEECAIRVADGAEVSGSRGGRESRAPSKHPEWPPTFSGPAFALGWSARHSRGGGDIDSFGGRMRATFTIVGVLALTVMAPHAQSQTGSRVKLGAAFGPGWETRGAGGPSGTHFALSATLRPSTSRFSYRLETMLDATERSLPGAASRKDLHRHATFALTLNAVRRFSKRSTGLYAIAGLGLYHQWNELIQASEASETEMARGVWANVNLGLNAGLGYTFHVRGHEMFLESRYHTTGFESRVPLSFGIRI